MPALKSYLGYILVLNGWNLNLFRHAYVPVEHDIVDQKSILDVLKTFTGYDYFVYI